MNNRLSIYPSKWLKTGMILVALLFWARIPLVQTGGWQDNLIDVGIAVVLTLAAVHIATMRVVVTGKTVELYYLWRWRRGSVRLDDLRRVEDYADSTNGTWLQFIRLEDRASGVVKFSRLGFSNSTIAQFAARIQQVVASSPDGAKKDFVVLDYLQGKTRIK